MNHAIKDIVLIFNVENFALYNIQGLLGQKKCSTVVPCAQSAEQTIIRN